MVLSYVSNLVPGEKLQVGPILYIRDASLCK